MRYRRICCGLVLAMTSLAACGSSSTPLAQVSGGTALAGLRGDVLKPSTKEPLIDLRDTSGAMYNVATRDADKTTLLYFGYTNCPDICPHFMADIAAALRESSSAVRSRVTVVFISVDPRRDTLPVIRRWLNHFNSTFVGLRAPIQQVIKIQKAVGVPVSKVDPHSKNGYTVQHSAELLAFTPDKQAHVVYTDGPSTISDLQHDLGILTTDKALGA